MTRVAADDGLEAALASGRLDDVAAWLDKARRQGSEGSRAALHDNLATCQWLAGELERRKRTLLEELRTVRGARHASAHYETVADLSR